MIYEKLRRDHRETLQLFDRLASTGEEDLRERERLLMKLRNDLIRHSRAEERVFYPMLREKEDAAALVEDSVVDHRDFEEMLDQMGSIARSSEEWLWRVLELRENVEHHIQEEETILFEKARAVLSEEEASELGERFEREKTKAA